MWSGIDRFGSFLFGRREANCPFRSGMKCVKLGVRIARATRSLARALFRRIIHSESIPLRKVAISGKNSGRECFLTREKHRTIGVTNCFDIQRSKPTSKRASGWPSTQHLRRLENTFITNISPGNVAIFSLSHETPLKSNRDWVG